MIASQGYQGGTCSTPPKASGLRRLRRERALSQRDLAHATGVELDAVNRIETGRRDALPSTLRKLADALRVQPPELIKGEE